MDGRDTTCIESTTRKRMDPALPVDPCLTSADAIVLDNLLADADEAPVSDQTTIKQLTGLTDETSTSFEPTIFATWDLKDVHLPAVLQKGVLQPYIRWAQGVVRRPTDVIFLNHILFYLTTALPSALYLFYHFSYTHAICHWVLIGWSCGAFTLMLHNHIHNHGVLAKPYAVLDQAWPYVLEPLMGHTWDSYYYHHVKHHHVENNGPDDLSSTIRYQRDELTHFLHYVGRFLLLVWLELPLYFVRKRKMGLAVRAAVSELGSYLALALLARWNFRATLFVFIIPLVQMRIGMMVGNWGQHALVDEIEPDSDFRSSITLIDVPSNRYCFNDGYHTSHHLNPRRHWRDHPASFMKAKEQYASGRALVFRNIDYIMMTITLLRHDYDHLARCLVPIGEQIQMSHQERVDLLRQKTRRFSEEEIRRKFPVSVRMGGKQKQKH
ncbi:MAG: hypothetical protein M4579_007485 [Chaenotheca gracillima]|nr:MAG: hypothetical protein M4579_007485 [Chaenotheca gracillima]